MDPSLATAFTVTSDFSFGVYGAPLPELAAAPPQAAQFSPLVPGAHVLEEVTPGRLGGMVMAAPPGTVERQYALALALRALAPGAPFTVMVPKAKGGGRIAKELETLGCAVTAESRRHQRVCRTTRPEASNTAAAITAGGLQRVDALNLWSQPGVFSWDRVDPGTALLISALPQLSGRGADVGCGIGVLARAALASAKVTALDLIDIDRRAITAARRNVTDPRAAFHWIDVRKSDSPQDLDFVVMNPPFHDGGVEDRALGQTFVQQSHRMLRGGGTVWLVANLHLPYEGLLSVFAHVALRAAQNGYKVYEARK